MHPIHIACTSGNLDVVRFLISVGADINVRDGTGVNPITYAALDEHYHLLQPLIAMGADIHAEDKEGSNRSHRVSPSLVLTFAFSRT